MLHYKLSVHQVTHTHSLIEAEKMHLARALLALLASSISSSRAAFDNDSIAMGARYAQHRQQHSLRHRAKDSQRIEIDGAVTLFGFFPIHELSRAGKCDVLFSSGVFLVEAALFALDRANAMLPPGVTLGAEFVDSCSSAPTVLYESKRLVRRLNRGRDLYLGVVGPADDDTLEQSARVLSVAGVGQIAYWSNSMRFADRDAFPHLLRTVPAAEHEVRAAVGLLQYMEWEFVHLVYSQGERSAFL